MEVILNVNFSLSNSLQKIVTRSASVDKDSGHWA